MQSNNAPQPGLGVPHSQLKSWLSHPEVFPVLKAKLREITGAPLKNEEIINFVKSYPDHLLQRLLKISADTVLDELFDLPRNLTTRERDIIKNQRFIIHGSNREDGTVSAVYQYAHERGKRIKPEIELNVLQLYVLFYYGLYYRVFTVENTHACGENDGRHLLMGLHDGSSDIDLLRIEIVPPDDIDNPLLAQISPHLQRFNVKKLITDSPRSSQDENITFHKFSQLLQAAVIEAQSRFEEANHKVQEELNKLSINLENYTQDDINQINTLFQALKVNANIQGPVDSIKTLYLPPERTLNTLIQLLILSLRNGNIIHSHGSTIAARAQKPEYNKAEGRGKIVEDNNVLYLWQRLASYVVYDFSEYPTIKFLLDNLIYQPKTQDTYQIYEYLPTEKTHYPKIIRSVPELNLASLYRLSLEGSTIRALKQVLRETHQRKLQLDNLHSDKETIKAKYNQVSTEALFDLYSQQGGVWFVRKLKDVSKRNPKIEFLDRYDGNHVLPATLIQTGLRSITYTGAWTDCSGVVVLRNNDTDQIVAAYSRPAFSNALSKIQLSKSSIADALRHIGGKPYHTVNELLTKLRIMQGKSTFELLNENSHDIIARYVRWCMGKNKELMTEPPKWNKLKVSFLEFLTSYLELTYSDNPQAKDLIFKKTENTFNNKYFQKSNEPFSNLVKKTHKASKVNYLNKTEFISEVLLTINHLKRQENLGFDDDAVIREILLERCGDVVAVFVKLTSVESILDALVIGEALTEINHSNPLYVVLDENKGAFSRIAVEKLREMLTTAEVRPYSPDEINKIIRERLAMSEVVQPDLSMSAPNATLFSARTSNLYLRPLVIDKPKGPVKVINEIKQFLTLSDEERKQLIENSRTVRTLDIYLLCLDNLIDNPTLWNWVRDLSENKRVRIILNKHNEILHLEKLTEPRKQRILDHVAHLPSKIEIFLKIDDIKNILSIPSMNNFCVNLLASKHVIITTKLFEASRIDTIPFEALSVLAKAKKIHLELFDSPKKVTINLLKSLPRGIPHHFHTFNLKDFAAAAGTHLIWEITSQERHKPVDFVQAAFESNYKIIEMVFVPKKDDVTRFSMCLEAMRKSMRHLAHRNLIVKVNGPIGFFILNSLKYQLNKLPAAHRLTVLDLSYGLERHDTDLIPLLKLIDKMENPPIIILALKEKEIENMESLNKADFSRLEKLITKGTIVFKNVIDLDCYFGNVQSERRYAIRNLTQNRTSREIDFVTLCHHFDNPSQHIANIAAPSTPTPLSATIAVGLQPVPALFAKQPSKRRQEQAIMIKDETKDQERKPKRSK